MSNRILRESITGSAKLEKLSPVAEVFFYRLMVVADDFGLMDARLGVLKGRCFPIKQVMTEEMLEPLLHELEDANLIGLYSAAGKPYLAIKKWDQHQRLRAKRPKYPAPPTGFSNLREDEPELTATRGHLTAIGGEVRLARAPVTPAESELELESESELESEVTTGKNEPVAPKAEKVRRTTTRKPTPEGLNEPPAVPIGVRVWGRYREAYEARYKAEPVRNAVVNSQITQIVKRLGEAAPEVAAFYVRSDNPFYVRKGHALGGLLSDCEKLHTEWMTNTTIGGAIRGPTLTETRAATVAALTGKTNPRLSDS